MRNAVSSMVSVPCTTTMPDLARGHRLVCSCNQFEHVVEAKAGAGDAAEVDCVDRPLASSPSAGTECDQLGGTEPDDRTSWCARPC